MNALVGNLIDEYDAAQRCFHNYKEWTDEQWQPIYDATGAVNYEIARLEAEIQRLSTDKKCTHPLCKDGFIEGEIGNGPSEQLCPECRGKGVVPTTGGVNEDL